MLTIEETDAYRTTRPGAVVEPMRQPGVLLPAAATGSFFAYLNAEMLGGVRRPAPNKHVLRAQQKRIAAEGLHEPFKPNFSSASLTIRDSFSEHQPLYDGIARLKRGVRGVLGAE